MEEASQRLDDEAVGLFGADCQAQRIRQAVALDPAQDQPGAGQRGVGMYRDWLYFESPDGWFISLNAKDGKERWRKKIADEKLQYFTTMAPPTAPASTNNPT